MKKCLVLLAGIPEWDLIKPGEDGWPDSIVESIRFKHVHHRWRKWLIEKNPDVQFDLRLSWDTTFVSPSGEYLKKHMGLKKRYIDHDETIKWICENCMGRNGYNDIVVNDLPIVGNGKWELPTELSDQKIYSPNIMPFVRMFRVFQQTKNMGYDYFVYARPDSFIKSSLYLDKFENTASIFTPSENWGGLFFNNKDFDYMWGGTYEAVQRLLRLFVSAPHIQLQPHHTHKLSEKRKLEICSKYDLFGIQFRKEDNVTRDTDQRLLDYLVEIENYWYACIDIFENEGYNFSTTHNHGILCILKQAMLQPHPKYDRGERPW